MGYSCRLPPFGGESGRKGLKGIRGPDTPPCYTGRRGRHSRQDCRRVAGQARLRSVTPRPALRQIAGPLLRAVRGPSLALRVPSDTKKWGQDTRRPIPIFLFARLRRNMFGYIIIYKVGWVAYRTIFCAGGLDVITTRQGPRTRQRGRIPCITLMSTNAPHAPKVRCLRQRQCIVDAVSRRIG